MTSLSPPRRALAAALVLGLAIAGCGSSTSGSSTSASSSGSSSSTRTTTVKLLLPGVASATIGGYIAAADTQAAKDNHLDIQVQNAGASAFNTLPQLASGAYQFTLSMTSNVLLARQQHIDAEQIYAPHGFTSCLMAHAESGVRSFADLKGKTVAIAPGNAWWPVVAAKYGLQDVKTVAYTGTVAPFLANSSLVQQCYVTNEPFQARDRGAKITVLPIAQSGFNPYADTLVTTSGEIRKDPQLVRAVVAAVAEGWRDYDADPSAVFAKLSSLGDTATDTERRNAWTALKPYSDPTGTADDAKVRAVADALVQTKALQASGAADYRSSYTNQFIPGQ